MGIAIGIHIVVFLITVARSNSVQCMYRIILYVKCGVISRCIYDLYLFSFDWHLFCTCGRSSLKQPCEKLKRNVLKMILVTN